MKKTTLFLAMGLAMSGLASAQSQLAPEEQRISDAAIHADYQTYQSLQQRIHRLNEAGVPVRDYHLSKAQCWLDVSLHEYTRNDRSAFPQEAMGESEKLIVGLETKTTPLSVDTALINGAARLRPDLWARTQDLKLGSGFACASQQVACAEVELVHAGNEFNQQQWRHAKPYVQIAEDLVTDASESAAHCAPAPTSLKALPEAPACVPAVCTPAPEQVALSAQVLFDFDKYTPDHIRSRSRSELDALVARAKREGIHIEKLNLVGHADRLNSTGNKDYNQQLSQRRVQSISELLSAQGLVVSSSSIDARGDSEQVVACQTQFKKRAELEECLLPNRRVDVELTGVRR